MPDSVMLSGDGLDADALRRVIGGVQVGLAQDGLEQMARARAVIDAAVRDRKPVYGVTTGLGAVMFTAKVEPNSTAVVFGLGGIGLNVIQGLKLVGARQIVGVDTNPAKEAMARQFGMTDFVNPQGHQG